MILKNNNNNSINTSHLSYNCVFIIMLLCYYTLVVGISGFQISDNPDYPNNCFYSMTHFFIFCKINDTTFL